MNIEPPTYDDDVTALTLQHVLVILDVANVVVVVALTVVVVVVVVAE